MKCRCVVFPEPRSIILQDVELPELGARDVLVEIEYSTISAGTELHCLNGTIQFAGGSMTFPFAAGYQAAGIVSATGDSVHGIARGDRVYSSRGKMPAGWRGKWWGGHAQYHVADSSDVIRLPDSVSTRRASSLLLAQVGMNGATRPDVRSRDVAVVIGDGLVGQYAAQVLRHRGAHVILSGHRQKRLELALRHSADKTVNARETDFFAATREAHPDGVQIVVETTGKVDLIRQAAGILAHGGQLVVLGYYPPGECSIDIHWLRTTELSVHFPNGQERKRMLRTMELVESHIIKTEELITHEIDASQAAEAYAMLTDGAPEVLGLRLRWQPGGEI